MARPEVHSLDVGSVRPKRNTSRTLRGWIPLRSAESVEHQFHATGDSQFVEDADQIIPYGVFAQVELQRDLGFS